MHIDTLIKKFNQPDVHLVVSQWPEDNGNIYHGVAVFAKETILTLARNRGMRFVVLADTGIDNTPRILCRGRVLVLRVFDHKHPTLYPTILTWLSQFPSIGDVTIHSEFGSYSGMKHFVLLIPFLLLIRLTGRQVIFFAHNVVTTLEYLAGQLGIDDPLIRTLLTIGVTLYNRLLGVVAHDIVCLDSQSVETLKKASLAATIHYLPHWVKSHNVSVGKYTARKHFGIPIKTKVVLAFGFVSWYKGTDILANLFAKMRGKNSVHVLFAGGKHVNIEHTGSYQRFYNGVTSVISGSPNMTITGFLPEKEVSLAFAAADLVVFPYRGLMGGSGALAYAIGHGKPLLVSTKMATLFDNPDIAETIASENLTKEFFLFMLNTTGRKKIVSVLGDDARLTTLARVSKAIAAKRDITVVCRNLYNEIYAPSTSPKPALSFSAA